MYTLAQSKAKISRADLDALLEELKILELEQSLFVEH
jgi:hypothetical protein